MKFTPFSIHLFLLTKLPSAYFSGVRVANITQDSISTYVIHRWINQNPFNSMYFAVQLMAAELSTGLALIRAINASNENFSMLVIHQEAQFTKKATGKIIFTCHDISKINTAIHEAKTTNTPQTFTLTAQAMNENNEKIGNYHFTWSIKKKEKK